MCLRLRQCAFISYYRILYLIHILIADNGVIQDRKAKGLVCVFAAKAVCLYFILQDTLLNTHSNSR